MARDKDYFDDDISSDEFSLESILAEYKGSAFIDGDKKTPPDILDKQAQRIVMEVTGGGASADFTINTDEQPIPEPKPEPEQRRAPEPKREPEPQPEPVQKTEFTYDADTTRDISFAPPRESEKPAADYFDDNVSDKKPDDAQTESEPESEPKTVTSEQIDDDILFFDNYRYSAPETQENIADEVKKAVEQEERYEKRTREGVKRASGIFNREKPARTDSDDPDAPVWRVDTSPPPGFRERARAFGESCNDVSLRFLAAFMLTLIMIIVTFAFEAGKSVPLGIGTNFVTASGALLILQLMVMMTGTDVLIRGAESIVRGRPCVESLVFASSLITVLSGIYGMKARGSDATLPYSAISACSVTLTLWGDKLHFKALSDTLRTAAAVDEPYAVVSEYRSDIDKTIIKRTPARTSGFYSNLMQPSVCESVYELAAPILLVAGVVLTVLSGLTQRDISHVPRMLAAVTCAAAALPASIAFASPFHTIAKRARKSGAAIAGAGGADDLYYADGVCITDSDLFPTGTVKLADGVKFYNSADKEKAARYTASLIIASGSGLARVFSDYLRASGKSLFRVEDFACYEGGVGALVRGERVMAGNAAFMNLMGIRIAAEDNNNDAVFTAINDVLVSMFIIEYEPSNSVQNALISLLRGRVKLFHTVRDFNITMRMIEQRFKIPSSDIENIPIQFTYDIADETRDGTGRVAAIVRREGLGSVGDTVRFGRLLRVSALLSTAVSVASSIFGVVYMAFMCWSRSFTSARVGNLLLFMLVPLVISLGVTAFAKFKR